MLAFLSKNLLEKGESDIFYLINYLAESYTNLGIQENGAESTRVGLERNVGAFVKRKEVAIFSATKRDRVRVSLSFSLCLHSSSSSSSSFSSKLQSDPA